MVSRAKKTYGYQERDPQKRRQFCVELATIPIEQRIYVDEAGMDERDDYGYAWCRRGDRFHALKSGKRKGRINMIAAYCGRQLMAPFTVEGACTRVVFETWLEQCLIPVLKPGQVLILDNATFHNGGRIAELVAAVGCRLLYLPPYSPDFNRIEKCWASIKSRVRKRLSTHGSLRTAIEDVLHEKSMPQA